MYSGGWGSSPKGRKGRKGEGSSPEGSSSFASNPKTNSLTWMLRPSPRSAQNSPFLSQSHLPEGQLDLTDKELRLDLWLRLLSPLSRAPGLPRF